ncbi:MAG: hemolysin family protein [Bacteroidetes bacterium]|nr:hemolysin family protein [Bacteroidota bacterium]
MTEPPSAIILFQVDPNSWLMVLICLLFIAFFSGMEIAFLSASRLRIELRNKEKSYAGKWLSKYVKNQSDFISTVLVGTNLGLVIYGIYMGEILNSAYKGIPWMGSAFLLFFMVAFTSTMIVLVVAEYLPKTFFKMHADKLLFSFVVIFRVAHCIMWPLIMVVKGISSFLLNRLTKTAITENTPVFSKVDLDNYIASIENSGNSASVEIDTEVFRNALDFSDAKVKDFMVHRTALVGVDSNDSVEILCQKFAQTALSKILVYEGSNDHIIGFVHHSDLFHAPKSIKDIIKPVLIVNEGLQAHDMLRNFIQERKSIAIVVDEFGGTAGMVSVEDILEEIVGEIEDEFDVEDRIETKFSDKHFLFSARLEIDYLNAEYNIGIPEGEYTTLGGYIIFCSESIPQVGEIIHHYRYEFTIKTLHGARIEEVELHVLPEEN